MIPGVFPKRTDPVTEEFKRIGALPGEKPKGAEQEPDALALLRKAGRPEFVSLAKAKRIALAGLSPETADLVNSYLYSTRRKLDVFALSQGDPRMTDETISPIEPQANDEYFVVPTSVLDFVVPASKRPEGLAKMREYVDAFKAWRERQGGSVRTGRAVTEALTSGPTPEETRLQGLANTLPFEMGAYQRAVGDGSSVVPVKPEWKAHYPEGFVPLTAALKMLDNKGLSRAGMTTAQAEAKQVFDAAANPNRGFSGGAPPDAHLTREQKRVKVREDFTAETAAFLTDALGGSPNAAGWGAVGADLVSQLVTPIYDVIDPSSTFKERMGGAGMTLLNVLPLPGAAALSKGAKFLLGDANYLTRELGKRGIKDAAKVAQRLADVVDQMPEAQVDQAVDALRQADAQGFLAKAAKAAEGVVETGEPLDLKAGLNQVEPVTAPSPRRRRPTVTEPTQEVPIGDKTTPVELDELSGNTGELKGAKQVSTAPTVSRETPQVESPVPRQEVGSVELRPRMGRDMADDRGYKGGEIVYREHPDKTGVVLKGKIVRPADGGAPYVQITSGMPAGQRKWALEPGWDDSPPISRAQEGTSVAGTKAGAATEPTPPSGFKTGEAVHKTKHLDEPVTVESYLGEKGGRHYVKVKGSDAGVPLDEIEFPKATEPQAPAETFKGARRRSTAEPPKEPPIEVTKTEVLEPEPGGTAARHADIDALRKNYGLSERTERYKADESLMAEAQAIEPEAVNIARASTAAKRIMSDKEQVAVAGGIESRRIKFNAARRAFDEAATKGDRAAKIEAQVTMDALSAEMQDMARALDESGSEAGAAMRARRFVAEAIEGGYAEPDITYRFTKATGRQPDRVERRSIQDQAAKIAELEDQVAKAEAKAATDRKFIEELQKGLNSVPRARSSNKVFTQKAYDDAVKRLKVGVSGARSGATTIPSDIVDMSIVAGYHIETGLRSLPEIYKAIRAALPDATDAQINLATKHALDQIDAVPKKASKAVENTLHDLRKEVKSAVKGATNVVDFDTAYKRIDEIEAIIKDPTKGIDELESAWADLTELRRKYGQGSSYGFDVLVQGKYGVQVEGVSELRYTLDRAKRDSQGYLEKSRKRAEYESLNDFGKAVSKAGTVAREVKNLPAQAVASLDVSYTGRQGLWFSLNPRYRRASKEMFQAQIDALKSQDGYERAAFAIRNNKNFDRLRRAGLIIEGEAFGAGNAEMFESAILGKVAPYKASGRAYEMAGNMQRVQVADDILTGLERFGEPLDDDAVRIVTDYVNAATGRGSSKFTKSLQALQVMWAPRLVGGRMELLAGRPLIKAALYGAKTGDYRLMRRVAEDYAAFGAMTTAVLAAAKLAGAEVDVTDPGSADWLKIKLGDTRIDMLGGFQQPTRFLYRMYGAMMESASEKESNQRPSEIAIRFGRSKLNPLFGEAANWLIYDREDYIGDKVTPLSTAINLTTPLSLREGVKTTLEGSPEAAALGFFLNVFGIGASTYKDEPKSRRRRSRSRSH